MVEEVIGTEAQTVIQPLAIKAYIETMGLLECHILITNVVELYSRK